MTFHWGNSRRFNAYANYTKSVFGERVQKVSINAGFTCPNRDGSIGRGGCTYCNNNAFNPSYCAPEKPILQQIQEGIDFHKKRYRKSKRYLAYFQAYSNTYDSLERLKSLYEEALSHPEVIGLVIGTRPDCIDAQKLDYLQELAKEKYISIEYGIESCYDKTLEKINRGHRFQTAVDAIQQTADRGLNVGGHLIFGLPGESMQDMLNEAELISALPIKYIKFHQLQIIKGTQIAKEFKENPENFKLFNIDEYLHFFANFIVRLNPEIVIERFVGEAPPKLLENQLWKLRNDQFIKKFEELLEEQDQWQGKHFKTIKHKKFS